MKSLDLPNKLGEIKTRADFSSFILDVLEDFKNNASTWENTDLANFLEAMAAWTEDMDGFYANQGKGMPENIQWKVFAEIIYAARIYE
ncbi:DUF7660 family protein [Microbulbifer sp. JMSA008]|uniref:DUF7660 family protein n=1 Tax=Microbulbifer sp. JMSA008 TaxID=3243373 RepID=UPI00403960BA